MTTPLHITTETPWEKYAGTIDTERACPWGLAVPLDVADFAPWERAVPMDVADVTPWEMAEPLDVADVTPWAGADIMDVDKILPWEPTIPTDPDFLLPWAKTTEIDPERMLPWDGVQSADVSVSLPWGMVAAADVEIKAAWAQINPADVSTVCPWVRAVPMDVSNFSPFERKYIKEALRKAVVLPWAALARYIMSKQDIIFYRVSDNAPVKLLEVSASIDEDSWAWSFSGTLPSRADANLIRPGAVVGERETEVYLSINGYAWKFWVKAVAENVSWAKGTYRFTGRSKSVVFGDEYCPSITASFPAQPIQTVVGDLLQDTGWTWTWNLLGNTWNLTSGDLIAIGATKMDILTRIAAAVGGVIQTDRENQNLIFQSRFPVSPELWATVTPDVSIVSGIMSQGSEADPRPGYNQVIVSGQKTGVIGTIQLTGTAGDVPAAPIVSPLLTNTAVVTERGRVELAENGHDFVKESLTLALPGAGTSPPLLSVGQLVAVADLFGNWRGKVAGVSVSASPSKTRQNVTVMRLAS